MSSINLKIGKGEFFSLLGPSGCGKSTLLRIIAGLESADSGEIHWDGKRVDTLPARERPFNMVFQKYALFPHLTVSENIAFSLKLKKVDPTELDRKVKDALHLVNLNGFGARLPETLSGGQAQRVALARALVNEPSCLLLDEPLAALDQRLREHMQTELRELQKRLGLTFIFVTHDQEEAMVLSDRIAVMHAGRVEQVSEPRGLYENPSSIFCARFIGRRNELQAEVVGKDNNWLSLKIDGEFNLTGRSVCRELESLVEREGRGTARVFIQPEKLRVRSEQKSSLGNAVNFLAGEVLHVLFRGGHSEIVVGLSGGGSLRSFSSPSSLERSFVPGDRVAVEFQADDMHVFLGEP